MAAQMAKKPDNQMKALESSMEQKSSDYVPFVP